jgi:hypothetical protein
VDVRRENVDKAANDHQAQQLSFGFPQHQNFPSWLTMTRLFIVSDQLCHDMLGRITVMISLYI